MAGARCLMRPSVAGRKLPRSLGVCRAYVGKAIEYGSAAAFVNVGQQYGLIEPGPELVKLVDTYRRWTDQVNKQKS